MTLIYEDPSGIETSSVSNAALKQAVTELPSDYWDGEVGTGVLRWEEDGENRSLLILPNLDQGRVYLKYVAGGPGDREEWLSLNDPSRLGELWECADEWSASAGLFLTPDEAWIGVEEFIRTGQRSTSLKWIQPCDLPEEGSW